MELLTWSERRISVYLYSSVEQSYFIATDWYKYEESEGYAMVLKSIASSAKSGTKSIKSTVPEGVVEFLSIKSGDTLEWTMVVHEEGDRVSVVKRSES